MSDAEPPTMYVLEPPTPLSRSMVWHLQRTFYADQGIEAWSRSGVPQSVTNSPNIARAYARVVSGFLRDLRGSLDFSQPVYIVELGAGSGRLAYRFLKAFAELHDQRMQRVVYVLTDATPSVVAYWRDNPRLQTFVASGVLDFAQFDLVELAPLTLLNSGVTLAIGTVVNPVVVFANYIFDTIPQDAYTIKGGDLYANLVTISASQRELDLKAPDSKVRIGIGFTSDTEPTDLDAEPDPAVREIMHSYRERLDDTTVVIPRAAMTCIRFFKDMGRGRALFVISDFGDTQEDELRGHGPPGFGASGGLWLAVNFHALGEFAGRSGGRARHPRARHIRLNTSLLLFGDSAWPETDLAFADVFDRHGPDDLALLSRAVGEHSVELSFEELLALLRTTGWDSDFVVRCVPALIDALPKADARLARELVGGVHEAWEQYYPIGESDDLPFALGAVLFTLERFPEALEFFEISARDFGHDPRTTMNLALCLYRLRRLPEALEWLDRTLELDPANETAAEMRQDVAKALASSGESTAEHVE